MLGVTLVIAFLHTTTKPMPDPPAKVYLGVHSWRTEQGAWVRFVPRRVDQLFLALRWFAQEDEPNIRLKQLCQDNGDLPTECRFEQTGDSVVLHLTLPIAPELLAQRLQTWRQRLSHSLPSALSNHQYSAANTWVGLVGQLTQQEAQIAVEQLLKFQSPGKPLVFNHRNQGWLGDEQHIITTSANNPSLLSAYVLTQQLNEMTKNTATLELNLLQSVIELTRPIKLDTLRTLIEQPPNIEKLYAYWQAWHQEQTRKVDHAPAFASVLSQAAMFGWPREHLLFWHQRWIALNQERVSTQWQQWYEVQATHSQQTLQTVEHTAHHRR